jgi:hypothetical protein
VNKKLEYFLGLNSIILILVNMNLIINTFLCIILRFAWVETAFLWQWWQEQDETMRDKMWTLVNNGQLEITGGAWSMHDEAVTHYHSIIDQFTWGFR